ncbi:hypothetical protein BDP27DRAFT_1426058 [Rhodocollybia butyracea]|uniref:Uncharacterized protein n=1 Tax=Rhodocollybia butyracea TaxID=206335 RepID=A0A9P5PIX1_9AGAR|nr:hypothetical protein BDP27DRAFT_1426058 [Rhodocollybia butyracea]
MAQPSVMSACHALPKPLYTIEDNEDNFTEYARPALISRQVTVWSTVPPYSQVGMGWGPLNLEDTVLIWNAIKDNNAAKKYSLNFLLSYTSTRIFAKFSETLFITDRYKVWTTILEWER